ncbi:TPA: HlyD family type I secretion periplasmic adaptor subunit [Enterobacter roggenkampii]
MLISHDKSNQTKKIKRLRMKRLGNLKKDLQAPSLITLGLLAFIFLLFLWAFVFPLRMVIRAEGKIIPSNRSQVVQHLEGGQVLSIDVSEGQFIEKGKLLARIRDVMVTSQISERDTKKSALRAKISRLNAEANGFDMNSVNNNGEDEYYSLELNAWRKRKEQLVKEINIYMEQINQKQQEYKEKVEKIKNMKAELSFAQDKLHISEEMFKLNAASKLEVIDAKSNVQSLKNALSEAQAALPRIESLIEESKSRAAEKESRFRSEATVELIASQSELKKVEEELNVSRDRLMRTELRSPVTGYIKKINISTIGEVIQPGAPVFEITPSGTPVIVEAEVKPSDRAELSLGLPVQVTLSAYNYATYGYAKGKLTEISSDTIQSKNGDYFYRVKIMLDQNSHSYGERLISPGMVATAEIVVGKRTVLNYLLSPLLRFSRTALTEPR